jgi:hypothetical protein
VSDAFGHDLNVESSADQERGYIAELPGRLRGLVCRPTEPWVSERGPDGVMPPGGHDHGHTMCYFVNLAADHIEKLRRYAELLAWIMASPDDRVEVEGTAVHVWRIELTVAQHEELAAYLPPELRDSPDA